MKVLSVDLGATNGKVVLVEKKDSKLSLKEIARFRTKGVFLPTKERSILVWNTPKFYEDLLDILNGLEEDVESLGVDSWGVDFALLDSKGRLIFLPYHYRDERTIGVMEKVLEKLGKRRIYEETAIQFLPINTLYQLYSMVMKEDPLLDIAKTFLMIADLFNYWLSGEIVCEYTLTTTSQCYSVPKNDWAWDLLKDLSIPIDIFPEVVKPGTILGRVKGVEKDVKVIATACHDTASAVVAVPFEKEGIYISSGTWSLIGTEADEPIVNEKSLSNDFTNEGGVGKIRFLKDATGMWLLEECNREWNLDYSEIMRRADSARSFIAFIDPDDRRYLLPGKMTKKISEYLKETGQDTPKDVGEFARLIFENLAFNYRWVIEKLEDIVDRSFDTIHIVGGASRNELVNQFTANVTGKRVIAGPYEATSLGNAMIQFITLGEVSDVKEARRLVRESFPCREFLPEETDKWEEKYQQWREKVGK